ncbi:Fe2+-dependent dioxygenase [Brevundimonas sp.]|uniref:Fe2+-dependent dioxygenase n=1 Tax=Brevundimonas sp. TaxID=1871086 RepID=UPI0025D528E9|nr:Fe2+-dependent dioxygenase [Brevundimonas sp.]
MLTLGQVLTLDDVERVRNGLARAPFRDGRATAGPTARKVKRNQQAVGADPEVEALARFIRDALLRHPVFAAYARPVAWSRIIFSRYGPGDTYGLHTDDAQMAAEDGGRLRTDMSFTLFLSDPETYEGGALLLDGLDGEREHRPQAGDAVLYATGRLHRVTPVTAGERLAAVGWLQSLIRRDDQRELLFDLERVRAGLPDGEARLLLDKSVGGLLRQWGEI